MSRPAGATYPPATKMDFRRSGPLDERRRRVLMDEIASPQEDQAEAPTGGSAKGPVRAYHEAVLSQRQPKVTDLLPVRPLWVLIFVLLGLTGIATVEAIHVHAVALPFNDGAHLASLDARQRGSLADWYSSAILSAAAMLAVVVFGIRAHRIDDYRGRYRIWLWTAAALGWLSLDAATGIHDAIGLGLTFLAGKQVFTASLAAGCTLTWIVVYALIFGTIGLRLSVEVWPSRLSFVSLLQSFVLYLMAALLKLQILAAPLWLSPGLAESGLTLLAHLSLLSAVGFYARHVYLDATGRLKVHIDPDRKSKSKRTKLKVVKTEAGQPSSPAKGAAKTAEPAKFNTAPTASSPAKPGASISKSNVTAPSDDEEDYDEDDGQYANLSKSERRRLKKLARREQRRAA